MHGKERGEEEAGEREEGKNFKNQNKRYKEIEGHGIKISGNLSDRYIRFKIFGFSSYKT